CTEALDSTTHWPCVDRSEGRPHGKPELERLLREQRVVEDTRPLWVVGEDQSERDVQNRHEEADLETGRGLEVFPRKPLARDAVGVELADVDKRCRLDRLPRLYLTRVVERNQADRAGDRELLFDVEQQALVAADDQIRRQRIGGPDRADVEAAHAVLAA